MKEQTASIPAPKKTENNKTMLYVSIAVLVLVFLGGFFVVRGMTKPAAAPVEEEESMILDLPDADPSIVVSVEPKSDGRSIILSVSEIPSGTESIEYELSYNTAEGLPKGALGKIDVNGKTEVEKDVLLGTCSKNTCTYDEGVTMVDLVLKFNHPSGATKFTGQFSL
ncbi:hypothetical protein C4564_00915 [Candidatus Microgenomates bacterium]|nr:MAG: hypothetical protein C4564_00915 [Candidatus Microgenomates bacterium]